MHALSSRPFPTKRTVSLRVVIEYCDDYDDDDDAGCTVFIFYYVSI